MDIAGSYSDEDWCMLAQNRDTWSNRLIKKKSICEFDIKLSYFMLLSINYRTYF
jgi:hypothetical protein